ncbi:MAG: hypothetical protein U9O24_02160 [Campylobacterota bacterium]|nr:hypothetical protein [Campylobacterota bacterium]
MIATTKAKLISIKDEEFVKSDDMFCMWQDKNEDVDDLDKRI